MQTENLDLGNSGAIRHFLGTLFWLNLGLRDLLIIQGGNSTIEV